MIEWSDKDLDALVDINPDGPLVMLNLLRFKPDGGLEKYREYISKTHFVRDDFGAEIIFWGVGNEAVVADPGKEWDQIALVRYPNRKSFADMVRDPRFQALEHLRTAALVDSVLQATRPTTDGN